MLAIVMASFFYALLGAFVLWPAFRNIAEKSLATPTPTTGVNFAALDILRGISAVWVALFHASDWIGTAGMPTAEALPIVTKGRAGVPVFATLSGFLIYRSVQKVGDLDALKKFFLRRFFRIYPLYAFSVVSIYCFFNDGPWVPPEQFIAEMAMLPALFSGPFSNLAAWSLYVEIVFYLVVPAFFVVAGRHALLVSIVGVAFLCVAELPGNLQIALWKYFLLGIAASIVVDRLAEVRNEVADFATFAGGAILVYLSAFVDWFSLTGKAISNFVGIRVPFAIDGNAPALNMSIAIASFVLVIGAARSKIAARIVAVPPLRMLGGISYSVFMIHPLVLFATLPIRPTFNNGIRFSSPLAELSVAYTIGILLPAFITCSIATFLLIEKPFINLGRKTTSKEKTTIVTTILPKAGAVSSRGSKPERDEDVADIAWINQDDPLRRV